MANIIPARQGRYAVVDTETTDLSYKRGGRVIEVACVLVESGEISSTWSTLVNPGNDVDPGRVDIHRITRSMLDDAPSFEDISGELIQQLDGRIVVAHNARFDLPFLRNEFELVGITMPSVTEMCTLNGSRYMLPQLSSHRLGDLCKHFGIDLNGWHAAEADTVAAAKLHLALLDMAPALVVDQPEKGQWPSVPAKSAAKSRAA